MLTCLAFGHEVWRDARPLVDQLKTLLVVNSYHGCAIQIISLTWVEDFGALQIIWQLLTRPFCPVSTDHRLCLFNGTFLGDGALIGFGYNRLHNLLCIHTPIFNLKFQRNVFWNLSSISRWLCLKLVYNDPTRFQILIVLSWLRASTEPRKLKLITGL